MRAKFSLRNGLRAAAILILTAAVIGCSGLHQALQWLKLIPMARPIADVLEPTLEHGLGGCCFAAVMTAILVYHAVELIKWAAKKLAKNDEPPTNPKTTGNEPAGSSRDQGVVT